MIELDLSKNALGFREVRSLARALREDKTLQRLDLSQNDLRSDSVYRLGISSLAHAEMRMIDLRGRRIAKSTCERLEEKGRYKRCQIKMGILEGVTRVSVPGVLISNMASAY